jgi:hypothetical protein
MLHKEAGVVRKALGIAAAVPKAIGAASNTLGDEVFKHTGSEAARLAAYTLPWASVAVGGKAAYDSPTGQRLRYKLYRWKQRRAQKRALRQQMEQL